MSPSGWIPVARRRHRKPAVSEHMHWALALGFRPITVNQLEKAGILTREQLCQKKVRQLLAIPTMSDVQLKKVKKALGPAATPELDLPFWQPKPADED
jgi:hypothetical protein